MDTDPESYEAALEHQRTRPRPTPGLRQTGRLIMTQITEALGLGDDEDEVAGADMRDGAASGKIRVKVWDGNLHGRDEPEVVELRFGEVFEFDDWFYSFEIIDPAEAADAG